MAGELPGGTVSQRPLDFIWIVDTSNSMAAYGKIQALNNAVHEVLPFMRDAARAEAHAAVRLRVLQFGDVARWVIEEPVPLDDFRWRDLEPVGRTAMGAALTLAATKLTAEHQSPRAIPPVLTLVSDGYPTDDFDAGLDTLLATPFGTKAVRVAIAIGRDADRETLTRFCSPAVGAPLEANQPQQLTDHFRWVSTVPVLSQSCGASDDAPMWEVPTLTPAGSDDGAATW